MACVLLMAAPAAYAAKDLLELPALTSAKAAKAMLLGVVQTGGRYVAVGEYGLIVYSDDQGKTWQQAQVPVSVTLTAVYFQTPSKGWAVGHDGVILNTVDGGKKWVKQFDGNKANAIVIDAAAKRLKDFKSTLSEPLSELAAADLSKLENSFEDAKAGGRFGPSRPLFDVRFKNEYEGMVVGSFGQVFRTVDGGVNWGLLAKPIDNPDGFHYNALSVMPSGALVISCEAGKLFRSQDGGLTWTLIDTGYAGQLYGVLGLADVSGKDVLLAYGFGGHVFRSADDGVSWRKVDTGTKKSVVAGLVLADASVLMVTQNGHLLRSVDQGLTFQHDNTPLATSVVAMSRSTATGDVMIAGAKGVMMVSTKKAKAK